MSELVLTNRFHLENSHTMKVYEKHGGYRTARRALTEMSPGEILEEVKKSNLRGRGGAGFPTGMKWGFLPKDSDQPVYLCINADESEPGTFKDRHIIENDPHLLVEGIIITCYTIGSHQAYVYIRGEYVPQARILSAAIKEAYDKGYLGKNIFGSGFDLELDIYRGAGAYICGEETSMLTSLEGKKGYPRLKPPFPAVKGLYDAPTIINNVETIANIAPIVEKGGEWFAGLGTPQNGGTRIFSLSGHIKKPGIVERPMGYSLRKLIYEDGGGILDDLALKAVIPGGSSVPVLRPEEIDINLDFDSVQKAGSMLGSAAVIVMHEKTCMIKACERIIHFYWEESCGQCSPCREGTGWLKKIILRILDGRGTESDVDLLYDVADGILGNTICPLGDAAAMPVKSFVEKFRDEFIEFIRDHRQTNIKEMVG